MQCLKGKQSKTTFSKERRDRRSNKLLDVISSDVCGPFPVRSHDGSLYFVTFTDEASNFSAVYMISAKSEVFDMFKQFQAQIERLTNQKSDIYAVTVEGNTVPIALSSI